MSTIRKKSICKAVKFRTLKMQNFVAAKLNGFTVSFLPNKPRNRS